MKNLQEKPVYHMLKKYKPEIQFSNCARSNAIYFEVRKYAEEMNYGVVEYGMKFTDETYNLTGEQVKNFPESMKIVVCCGSGNTAKGIITGLKNYNKSYEKMYLMGVAPNRLKGILDYCEKIGFELKYEYVDIFSREGFNYDKPMPYSLCGIVLHPRYEAKAFRTYVEEYGIRGNELFYINGAEIKY